MMRKQRWHDLEQELEQIKQDYRYRELHPTAILEDGWLMRNGQKMLNLASNDYLGLNSNGSKLLMANGSRMGATASRLIVGNDPIYQEVEQVFAEFKGTERCLFFSNGYMANLGVISSLMGRHDVIFSDRLNHASIVDGIILSRAQHYRYQHRDLDHLESLLRKAKPDQRKLIVTDSIFSMDGDIAPLRGLVELKHKYGAMLMVDEAHSGGVYGEHGEGLVHALGLTDDVDIQMGTFSKAYGCYGAYVAGDAVLIEYLINKARSFIYTTALPPMLVLSIHHHWLQVKSEHWRREQLHEKANWFRQELNKLGFDTGGSETQIIPLIIGDNERTVEFSQRLQQEGIAAVAIRPPTVPEGTARIRFSVTSVHAYDDLEWAIDCIANIGRQLGLI